jgi:L-lactate dehydrogenase complex protein LldE
VSATSPPEVALFATCVVDLLFPETALSSVRLLEAAGCHVFFPSAQSCCGQPALTAGEPRAAARLARHFVEVFEPYEAVVAPSGSCAATVRHWYTRLLEGEWRRRAEELAARTYELTAYLVDVLGRDDLGARIGERVTMHDACHLLRNLGVRDAPRRLLSAAGATIVEMTEPETCCGFGGVFAVTHDDISTALADDKLADAAETGARYLVACDQACLMHLEGRRRRVGSGPQPVHVADLLSSGLPS